jgi:hypothetical protein
MEDNIVKVDFKKMGCSSKMDDMIDITMSEFNFERVVIAMNALNWNYPKGIIEGSDSFPPITVRDVRITARKLLEEVVDHVRKTGIDIEISTGGFSASYYLDRLKLEFILEEYYMDIEEFEDQRQNE